MMKLNKLALTIGIASLALVGLAHAQSQQFWMMKAVPILKPSGSGKPSPSIKLSTANDHGCAIVNGLAKCWGGNYVGNLGIGNTDSPMLSPQNVKYGD